MCKKRKNKSEIINTLECILIVGMSLAIFGSVLGILYMTILLSKYT